MKHKNTLVPFIARQGDVLIQRIASLPKEITKLARENGRVVLAHGKATGHHHSLVETHTSLYTSPVAWSFGVPEEEYEPAVET